MRLPSALLVALAAILVAVVRDFDSDLFWHLAAGERILRQGRVETADVFSWTSAGQPFINHEWLWDVVQALLHRLGGFELLVALKAALVGLVWLLLAGCARSRGATALATGFALLWGLVLVRFRLLIKPEVLSFGLLALVDLLCERYLAGGRRGWLLALVATTLVWANLHLLVVLGLGVIAAHALGEWFDRRRGRSGEGRSGTPAGLGLACAIGFCATLLNPYGPRVYEPVLKIYAAPAIVGVQVREWAPPDPGQFLLFWWLAPAAAVLLILTARALPARDWLLFGGAFAAACLSQRHIGVFAILATPVLALALTRVAASIPPAWRRPLPGLALLLLATLVATRALLSPRHSLLHQDQSQRFRPGLGLARDAAPFQTGEVLARHGLAAPLYNTWELGGYLIWRGHRVFLDGRHYVHERLLERLAALTPAAMLREWDIGVALVGYRDAPVLAALRASGRFQAVAFDDAAVLFVRDDHLALHPRLAAYLVLRPEDLSTADPAALAETDRGVIEAPTSLRAWLLRGAALRRDGQLGPARAAYEHALTLDPGQASAHNNLGLIHLARGDAAAARLSFEAALSIDPALLSATRNLALLAPSPSPRP